MEKLKEVCNIKDDGTQDNSIFKIPGFHYLSCIYASKTISVSRETKLISENAGKHYIHNSCNHVKPHIIMTDHENEYGQDFMSNIQLSHRTEFMKKKIQVSIFYRQPCM